jgi:hypothetical protein
VKEGVTDANRSQVAAAISKHAQVIEGLRDRVREPSTTIAKRERFRLITWPARRLPSQLAEIS